MDRETLLRAAGEAAPELMQKTAQILVVDDSVAADVAAVVDYAVEKLAYGPVAVWGTALGTSLVSGVAGNMAADMYDAAKRGMTRTRNFNAILQANPDLKSFDKNRLRASFDALHRFAPDMTSDPLVGGSLLKSVAEVPGNEAVVIKDIIQSRKNLIDAKQIRPGVAMELPTDMEERREQREIASDKWRRRVDRTNIGIKGKELKYQRERDEKRDAAETAKGTQMRSDKANSDRFRVKADLHRAALQAAIQRVQTNDQLSPAQKERAFNRLAKQYSDMMGV